MRSAFLSVLWLGLGMIVVPTMAASGAVIEDVSGSPIADATVYAVWYYHPIRLPLPVEMPDIVRACGGATVVSTDSHGEYQLGSWFEFNRYWHESQYWVVAPGYYDKERLSGSGAAGHSQLPSATQSSSGYSANKKDTGALTAFGDASLENQVLALVAARSPENCAAGRVEPFAAQHKFDIAIQRAIVQSICDSGQPRNSLRTDTFRAAFPPERLSHVLWRELVDSLLPQDGSLPVPELALANVCAIFDPQGHGYHHDSAGIKGPAAIRIALREAQSGSPIADVPLRISWGMRVVPPRQDGTSDRDHELVVPRRSIVLTSDAGGNAEMPVTQAMLEEQGPLTHGGDDKFRYVVTPLALNWFAFAPGRDERRICMALAASPRLRQGSDITSGSCLSGDNFVELQAFAEEDWKRNHGKSRQPWTEATIHMYPWRWPAQELVSRNYLLLSLRPDVEADPEALLKLQRSQLQLTFDLLCAHDESDEVSDPHAVLRELWWIETQTLGSDIAARNVQNRARDWENGYRCDASIARRVMPRNPLKAATVCKAWQVARPGLDAVSLPLPPPFSEFPFDYSKREGACPHQHNFGSSL